MKKYLIGWVMALSTVAAAVALFGRETAAGWVEAAWRFFTTGAAMAGLLLVAACAGTPEERASDRELRASFALGQIEAFNAQGIDPLRLPPVTLLGLNAACGTVGLLAPEIARVVAKIAEKRASDDPVRTDPVALAHEIQANVNASCAVIAKAAAAAPWPEPTPAPASS